MYEKSIKPFNNQKLLVIVAVDKQTLSATRLGAQILESLF